MLRIVWVSVQKYLPQIGFDKVALKLCKIGLHTDNPGS